MVKLSVSIGCFFKNMPLSEMIVRIARLGYTAVEMWDFPLNTDPKEIRRLCDSLGISFVAVCPYEFCMNRPERRAAYLDGLKRGAEVASILGAKKLVTQVGEDTGEEREKQHNAILETLEASKPILDAHDVTLMLEPLNTLFDHKGYYLGTSSEGFALVEESAHPHIKLVYDIYHMQIMEGNVIPTVTANLDKIAHLHAAGHPGRHELWDGENDYRNIFAAIDRAGYEGFCGLEYRPLLSPEDSLARAIQTYGK